MPVEQVNPLKTTHVLYALHPILQWLTRSQKQSNFFRTPPFSRISGGSIRGIKVSGELKSFVFLRIGHSKCRPIPFFRQKVPLMPFFRHPEQKTHFGFELKIGIKQVIWATKFPLFSHNKLSSLSVWETFPQNRSRTDLFWAPEKLRIWAGLGGVYASRPALRMSLKVLFQAQNVGRKVKK